MNGAVKTTYLAGCCTNHAGDAVGVAQVERDGQVFSRQARSQVLEFRSSSSHEYESRAVASQQVRGGEADARGGPGD